ncbi:hypothetical protein [Nostoc sp.]|uniref:hypothetical protein n=1 Tax=Nostoc sp. TaxID=1180 RepID=UPI002FF58E25
MPGNPSTAVAPPYPIPHALKLHPASGVEFFISWSSLRQIEEWLQVYFLTQHWLNPSTARRK